jgi:hypothetical protein
MIVRILGEGQYEVPESALGTLDALDHDLNDAIEAGDESSYEQALAALIEGVRRAGSALDASVLVPSDLTVPQEHSTLADMRELLSSEPDTAGTVTEGA